MKIITLEEHYSDQRIMDANRAFQGERPKMTPEQEEIELIAHKNAERLLNLE